MKTSNRLVCFVLLIISLILLNTGCSKDSSSHPNANTISLTVGSKTLQSTRISGASSSTELALDGYPVSQGDTSLVHIAMLTSIKTGQPDSFQLSGVWYSTPNGVTYSGEAIHGGHGILTVTSWDSTTRRISGTFSGVFYNTTTGNDSVTISSGRFNSGYTTF